MNISKRALVMAAILLGAAPSAFASPDPNDLQWQAANGRPCDQVCRAARLQPVQSGYHMPGGRTTNDAFYICSADYNGYRPGYNLQPSWSKACYIPYGGKEVAAKDYLCACR